MNRDHEEAVDILLAGNALLDLRALVRNAPRESSLRATFEFLEGTKDYIDKVQAFIRAIEPTIAAPRRPDLAGHIPAGKSADDVTFVNHAFAFAGRWSGPPGLSHKLCGACGLSEVAHLSEPAADPSVCLSAPEPLGLGGRTHGTIDGRWCVYCGAFKTHAGWRRPAAHQPYLPGAFGDHERDTREGPGSSTADDTGKTIT
jgi:hypothetical protein